MDTGDLKKIGGVLLPFIPDIIGFFKDKEHEKRFERVEKAMDKLAKNPTLQKVLVDETTYQDENLYWEALYCLSPEDRERVRGYMLGLEQKRGKKTKNNIIWAVASMETKESRVNRLREFASCKTYADFDNMLVADGMLTPHDETPPEVTEAFKKKWAEITEKIGEKANAVKAGISNKRTEIEKDFGSEFKGPGSGFAARMKAKYEAKMGGN